MMSHEPSADTSESNHGEPDSVGQRPDSVSLDFGPVQIERLQQILDVINSNLARSTWGHDEDACHEDIEAEESSANESDNDNERDDGDADADIDDFQPPSNEIIPEVRDYDLKSFHAAVHGEARHAIETLVQERFDWSQSATRLPKGRRGKNDNPSPSFHPPHPQPAYHEKPWLCRIRVNSTAIIYVIQLATGRTPPLANPLVFQWPFRTILYHHNRVKRLMDSLELKKERGERKGN